ncbi:hypothetical protein C8R46DRAFT_1064558 [Mycena filopes]|nr:hypothetical protein C8R46DRAFT_1064558 [Mycena filopes]
MSNCKPSPYHFSTAGLCQSRAERESDILVLDIVALAHCLRRWAGKAGSSYTFLPLRTRLLVLSYSYQATVMPICPLNNHVSENVSWTYDTQRIHTIRLHDPEELEFSQTILQHPCLRHDRLDVGNPDGSLLQSVMRPKSLASDVDLENLGTSGLRRPGVSVQEKRIEKTKSVRVEAPRADCGQRKTKLDGALLARSKGYNHCGITKPPKSPTRNPINANHNKFAPSHG